MKRPGQFSRLNNPILAAAGLGLGFIVSISLYFIAARFVENSAQQKFDIEVNKAQLAIQGRIDDYADIIHGLGALFQTSDSLTRAQFHRYVSGLNLQRKFPGIRSINYSQLISAANKAAFETSVQKDRSLDPGGYPGFEIKPPGNRTEYHVLTYLEPMQGNLASFGLDIASNPIVAHALALARDSGKLSASGHLINVVGSGHHGGLAMRLPLYRIGMPIGTVAERRAAYFGSVGAGFNMQIVMDGALDDATLKQMRVRLYDTGRKGDKLESGTNDIERMLFDSTAGAPRPPTANDEFFSSRLPMEVGGRIWEAHFSADKTAMLAGIDPYLPWLAMLAGLFVSLLLFNIYYSLFSSRRHAIELAEAMTKDLRESEASLADAQQMAHLGNWLFDPGAGVMTWSAETYRIFGLDPHGGNQEYTEFMYRMHEQDRVRVREALDRTLSTGKEFRAEHRIVHSNGSTRWVQTISRPGAGAQKGMLRGTIMDITERKRALLQNEVERQITQLVASSEDIDQVMPRVLEALCRGFGWTCGVYRVLSETSMRLRCAQYWGIKTLEVTTFLAGQRQLLTPIGSGLAGRAWELPEPVIIKDLRRELQMRVPDENLTTLRCGVAFSIRSGERVLGVIECFGTELDPTEGNLPELLKSVSNQISQYLQRKAAEQALLYVAAHDSLTDLPNRNMFNQALRHALIRDARYNTGIAVMLIDIDRFKIVNDTIGHSAGDRLLKECARRLTECLRDSDIVAGLGGDEFAVIVEQFTDPKDVSAVAKKILASVEQPFSIDDQEFLLTASIGISTFPDDGPDVETLLRNADAAMYRAKAMGNNYQYYSTQMNENNLARFAMETSLRHAIERKEFMLHYQPRLDLHTQRVTGVEALLRWQHPELGLVSPAQFIPLAEETGLIIEIGHWVLQEACRQARAWQQQGIPTIRVAVNLSTRQFNHTHLLRDIARTLASTGLDADCLELEITESMVMENAELAIKQLGEIKAMGIHLSIDDFGTGYSSLAYLRKLPVDCVKIDRAFIKDIPFEVDDMAISKSIITLGHSLRLKVVAEGVETREQLDFLKEQGCDEIQGYLFSKPLPTTEVTAFLERDCPKPITAVSAPQERS